jgi:hypothetical protein
MQRIANSTTRAQGIPQIAEKCNRLHFSLTAKIERTRAEVRRAQENVQASEGRLLDFDAAEAIQRALVAAARNLQELTLQVACLERKR